MLVLKTITLSLDMLVFDMTKSFCLTLVFNTTKTLFHDMLVVDTTKEIIHNALNFDSTKSFFHNTLAFDTNKSFCLDMLVFDTTKLRLINLIHKMICPVTFSSVMLRQTTILPGMFSSKLSKLKLESFCHD